MASEIEQKLGLGPIEKVRTIPGVAPAEGREVRYIEYSGEMSFKDFSGALLRQVPLRAKSGGVLIEGCQLKTRSGESFHALSYRGDLEGWRKQIVEGAELLAVKVGEVVNGNITFADGRAFSISECEVNFY